ncbi:MAG: saccharopine dehydrogenase C-terminal domain-containing protein [Ferruginibacter sp.]
MKKCPISLLVVDETGDLKQLELEKIKNTAASAMADRIHEANLTLKQLFFLGLDDNETQINKGFCSAADVLQFALEKKLVLEPADKDMIVMLHEIDYEINQKHHSIKSSLVVIGDDNLHTAMAKTVGLPLGIAAKMILNKTIQMKGVHIPVNKEIYEPVLAELKKFGVAFTEQRS